MASADRTSARWFRQYKILQLANVDNELTSSPVSTCPPESANYSDQLNKNLELLSNANKN